MSEPKETKELLRAVVKLSLLLVRRFKDGAQVEDVSVILGALISDPDYLKGLTGLDKLGDEFKDMRVEGYLDIVKELAVSLIPELLKELGKEEDVKYFEFALKGLDLGIEAARLFDKPA